ncbi:SACS, partial [Symbiodinium natans]
WERPSKALSAADPQSRPNQIQESVRAQLASLRHESKTDQKAAVKRLLVQWHPDRNPESQETATAIFQFIQQEKDKMLGL